MRRSPLRFQCCTLLALLWLLPAALCAERLVVARSSVFGDYLEMRRVDGKPQPQSYVFMPGRHLSGNRRDRSLERFSFRALAGRLAAGLRAQDFHPAASLAKADLVLVVHWGATAGRNRDQVALSQGFDVLASLGSQAEVYRGELDQAVKDGEFQRADELRGQIDQLASAARQEQQSVLEQERNVGGADTAALLGFTQELTREDGTLAEHERRKTLHELTREECYFVVVMAYDAPTLVESKRLKRRWSLRVSINTAGVNFPEAVDRIAQVASQHAGLPQEELAFAYPPARKREGTVTVGDIVVLGAVEP